MPGQAPGAAGGVLSPEGSQGHRAVGSIARSGAVIATSKVRRAPRARSEVPEIIVIKLLHVACHPV